MNIHILKHVPFEDIGAIDQWIKINNYKKSYTKLYESISFPEMNSFDFLIILGGPMGTYEEEDYPWLIEEKNFIQEAIKAKKKILGICLGSQLLADVLGAEVYKNNEKEIGWFPVSITPEGRGNSLLKDIEDKIEVFHWHGDTFTLPKKSIHLMSSAACNNQAYLYENNILAFQFHFESTPESVSSMVNNEVEDLDASGKFVQDQSKILDNLHYSEKANEILFIILERFLNL